MYLNFTTTAAPFIIPVTAKSLAFYNNIGLDALTILIAIGLSVLMGLFAVYLSCCGSSSKDQKLYAINHPDEVQNAMQDMGLM